MLLIGVGNEFRQDDGVGVLTARRLRQCLPPSVRVVVLPGEGTELMQAWAGENEVWIVDAVFSSAPAGTIHVIDAHEQIVPAHFFHYSTHAFSVAEAIELSKGMGILPPFTKVYGIEGERFGDGEGLSPAVVQAMESVIAEISVTIGKRIGQVHT